LHLSFDTEGVFGFGLLVVAESPASAWSIDGAGDVTPLAGLTGLPGRAVVAPASWGALAGKLIVPDQVGTAHAIDGQGFSQPLYP
jgi:hypothetical protein